MSNSNGRTKYGVQNGRDIRLPPQNLDAEKSVLGCQILDADKIEFVVDILKPSDFYSRNHAIIQQALLNMRADGKAVDPMTLGFELERMGKFEEIGGVVAIVELMETVPHGAHAEHYAELVAERSRRRKAIEIGQKLVESAYDMSRSETEMLESAMVSSSNLSELLGAGRRHKVTDIRDEMLAVIQKREQGHSVSNYWGIPFVDDMIHGTAEQEMVVIAGRPSHGKSLLGLQWINEAAAFCPCLIISEEMSKEMYAGRNLAYVSGIPSDQTSNNISLVVEKMSDHFANRHPILIGDRCGTIAEAERMIDRAVRTHGVKTVAVDYAQLLKGEGFTKEQQVGDVSTRMKQIAKKNNITLLLLAQLNREIEKRENAKPRMSDLKDSGSLEADADVILFVYWPAILDSSHKPADEYRIYVGKNRSRGIRESVRECRIIKEVQRIVPVDEQLSLSDRFD